MCPELSTTLNQVPKPCETTLVPLRGCCKLYSVGRPPEHDVRITSLLYSKRFKSRTLIHVPIRLVVEFNVVRPVHFELLRQQLQVAW